MATVLPDTRPLLPDQERRLVDVRVAHEGGPALWCVGETSLLRQRCVAVVGTREASEAGAARARRLGRELAQAGVVVVSGLAKGIDTHALTAAIEAGGRVAAVIGTPIDKAYPAENKRLQERIYREHLLISQFKPGAFVGPGNFPERNKLMAAVSDATVVVEAGEDSGARHQAAECARLGRWLFLCRSLVDDAEVNWPKSFLRNPTRTRVLTATIDILEALEHDSRP